MNQLKFEEIANSIRNSKNAYEVERGISTNIVKFMDKRDTLAFFVAEKSDNSKTLYFALQPDINVDHWIWICPNEEQIKVLTVDLNKILEDEKPTQDTKLVLGMRFDNIEFLIREIRKKLGAGFQIEKKVEGNTIMIIAASEKTMLIFIAVKPSRQYNHWYLFYPSIKQISLLIKDLGEVYTATNDRNDMTRWNNL